MLIPTTEQFDLTSGSEMIYIVMYHIRSNIMDFSRITVDPGQMGGAPCIRGLRIPVSVIVGLLAEGISEGQILKDYPDLEPEDIREALRFAAESVKERQVPLLV